MIHPVILCGGSGTRLWPLSRKGFPKQFTRLVGDESLFQASVRRLSGQDFGPPVVVTGSDFRFVVTEQLLEAGIDPGAARFAFQADAGQSAAMAMITACAVVAS